MVLYEASQLLFSISGIRLDITDRPFLYVAPILHTNTVFLRQLRIILKEI